MDQHSQSFGSLKSTDCNRGSDDESVSSFKNAFLISKLGRYPSISSSTSSLQTNPSTKSKHSAYRRVRFNDLELEDKSSRLSRKLHNYVQDGEFPMADVNIDKSTASQAVAFVIRASRRGVVPLCAEVADILKEKNSLEVIIHEQREEIEELMRNQAVPRSPSPPPLEMKDFSLQTVQEMCSQTTPVRDQCLQTDMIVLRCNQKRILTEEGSEPDKECNSSELPGVRFDCGKRYSVSCTCPASLTTSTQNPQKTSIAVNTKHEDSFHSELGYFDHRKLEHCHKILQNDHEQMKTQTEEAMKQNKLLSRDLDKAKEEIVSLQKAIQEIQTKELEKIKEEERLRMQDSYSVDVNNERDCVTTDSSENVGRRRRQLTDVLIANSADNRSTLSILPIEGQNRTATFSSSIFPGPILGCKCQMCKSFFRSSGLLGFASSPYVTDSSGRNPILKDLRKLVSLQNSKLQLELSDQVLIRNNKIGLVKYVGHLDGVGTPSVVYVGIELETTEGRHDGYLFGKRYFFCPQQHGLFLPLQDVLCVINKKLALPMLQRRQLQSVKSRREASISRKGKRVDRKGTKTYSVSSMESERSSTMTDEGPTNRLPAVETR